MTNSIKILVGALSKCYIIYFVIFAFKIFKFLSCPAPTVQESKDSLGNFVRFIIFCPS